MRERTAEQLQKAAHVFSVLASPHALSILQVLLNNPLTCPTYNAIAEETGLHPDCVWEQVQRLAEADIVIPHKADIPHNGYAGFCFLNKEMSVVAEAIIEELWSDVIRKWQVAS